MATKSNANIDHGVLVRQWKWPLRILFWWATIALVVWVGTLAVHWYWARTRAPESPVAYSQLVLQRELDQLGKFAPVLFDPVGIATSIANTVHDIAVDTSLIAARALMNWPNFMRSNAASQEIKANPDPGGDFVRRQLADAGDGWLLLLANTGLFAVRTATYMCALPLFALAMALGAADGLTARAKRKACAGHESASLYHRAKLAISFVAILFYVGYLAAPTVRHPQVALLALAAVLGILVRTQCKYYKKYL